MEIDRKELKARARASMALTQPKFWVVSLAYLALSVGVGLLVSYLPVDGLGLALFLSLFFLMLRLVVDFGMKLWSLWTCRRLGPGLDSLIQGFSVASQVVMLNVGIFVRLFCWTWVAVMVVLMLFPATLLAESSISDEAFFIISSVIFAVIFSGVIWAIRLRYALAPYLLADHPDDGSGPAIRRSVELMRGWKFELFKLEFSFLGWYLLQYLLSGLTLLALLWHNGFFALFTGSPIILTDAILLLRNTLGSTAASLAIELVTLPVLVYLTPYLSVSRAEFYNARLQLQQDAAPPL